MTVVNVNSVTINSTGGIQGYGPFYYNRYINSVDLGFVPWTNNSMYHAFIYCNNVSSITNINQNITNLSGAFGYCDSLINAPVLPNNATNMYEAFMFCYNLVNAPAIPNKVIDMYATFYECYKLEKAPIIPNSVKNMYKTFYECTSLVNAPVIPNSVTNMCETFYCCTNLVNAPVIPNSVTNISGTFYGCNNISGNIYVQSTNIYYAYNCFGYTTNTKNLYIPFNSSLNIYTNTYNAFNNAGYNTSSLKNGVTVKENPFFEVYNNWWWDSYYNVIHKYLGNESDIVVPNVINGHNITSLELSGFNIPKTISSIDFSNIPVSGNMYYKFTGCTQLQSITNLNTDSNITNMVGTFQSCTSLVNAPVIPNSVTNMYGAFYNCTSLINAPVIPNSVTNMYETFKSCTSLINAPVIPNSVTDMYFTFQSCTSLINAPVIPNSVINMYETFLYCTSLSGNIYIQSENISIATYCFQGTSLTKNVYIPFTYENGINTRTYNTFNAIYGSHANGVYLKDINANTVNITFNLETINSIGDTISVYFDVFNGPNGSYINTPLTYSANITSTRTEFTIEKEVDNNYYGFQIVGGNSGHGVGAYNPLYINGVAYNTFTESDGPTTYYQPTWGQTAFQITGDTTISDTAG